MYEFVPAPSGSPSPPSPRVSAGCETSSLCELIYRETDNKWVAESSHWLLIKPLTILTIIAVAFLVRWLVHRAIDRLILHTTAEATSTEEEPTGRSLLRPLRSRIPNALVVPGERRAQRARALGSVLRSVASVVIFGIAFMLALGELGINLGPIIASAGIVGLAVGFGAQNLVKDFLAGIFMLLEDQYGVGDVIDAGEASGTVEAVGLRITTLRDAQGVLWYIRNGEVVRVGNKSQGWALVIVDVPVGFAQVSEATKVMQTVATEMAGDPEWSDSFLAVPEVLGVEQITAEGATLRATVKTSSDEQWKVGRELRRRVMDALEQAGIAAQISAGRLYVRPPLDPGAP